MAHLVQMYGRILILIGIILLILFGANLAFGQITTKSDDSIDASETLTDMAFLAGKKLNISIQSTDDIFAAGGEIEVKGASADHLISVGGEIDIYGVDLKDLILAGGEVNLSSGTIDDDVVVAAGDLDIEPGFKIAGSAMLAAGDLTINTPIGGDLRAAGENIALKANVAGNAQLFGETVTIHPNVRIEGDLRYRAEEFQLDPTAVIVGTVTKLEDDDEPDAFEAFGMKAVGIIAVFALVVTLGLAILVGAIAAVFPGLMNNAAAMIRAKPLPTVGIGFLMAISGPAILALLFATVLGIPLALMIGAFYLVATPLAIGASAYFIGQFGRQLIRKTPWVDAPELGARLGWSFFGVVVLIIIGLIPFIGVLTWLLAFVFGLGAIVTKGRAALARG